MKARILIACVVLQVGILAWMAGEREWVRRTGRPVWFRTAPVDPRDVMRGDYVRLNYGMSLVGRDQWRGDLKTSTNSPPLPRDAKVYSVLREGSDGLAYLDSLGTDRPRDGLYLRGRTTSSSGSHVQVRYGLEAWFVEQGAGKVMEAGRGRDDIQVPLEMQAALSPGGLAVLRDYRWCQLGVGLTLVSTNVTLTNRMTGTRLISAKVRLLNASSNDLAIVDQPGNGSLELEPVNLWMDDHWKWAPPPQPAPGGAAKVIVLKPGDIHTFEIDFGDPRWSISKSDRPDAVKRLNELNQDWSARFRFVYRPPQPDAARSLPNANLIWHGELATRAFSAGAVVD